MSLTKVILLPIIPSPMSMTPQVGTLPSQGQGHQPVLQLKGCPGYAPKMLGTEEVHFGTRW